MSHAPILFLDIDGVLIAYPEGEHTPPQFTPHCVDAFRRIIGAVNGLRVVFSSTWRYPEHVNRLHEQWLAHDFPADLAIDATPDIRNEPNYKRIHARGLEIQRWLDTHPEVQNWVALDDEQLSIEPVLGSDRCIYTNPQRGLTFRGADRAISILTQTLVQE
ncbi:HAD domain-containing protein [Haloferula sp.]|uniref:HAD domain-containing protein n=1 Tax=Haloferula sp. TaxID=2497595 RepID=UPI003C730DB8